MKFLNPRGVSFGSFGIKLNIKLTIKKAELLDSRNRSQGAGCY